MAITRSRTTIHTNSGMERVFAGRDLQENEEIDPGPETRKNKNKWEGKHENYS